MKTLIARALSLSLLASPAAMALEAACEPFIAAAEKTASQKARHSVSELDDGTRIEAIVVDGRFFTSLGGKWQEMKIDLLAAERRLNAEVRAGKVPVSHCKDLGKETVDGIATRVIGYSIAFQGAAPTPARAYVGNDGLVYALSAEGQKVRYRYTGISAPKL